MKCPYCMQEHPAGTKFCPQTGHKMPEPKRCQWQDCPGRHSILSDDAKFCPHCGRPLEGVVSPSSLVLTVTGVTFKMIGVAGGTFTMGATAEQGSDAYSDESPTHRVTLSSYYIGETEVTQALWEAVIWGSWRNPSYWKGDGLPVTNVSWNDCQDFIRRLNCMTGKHFRLPTEAEWECAARGGSRSQGYKYSGSNSIDKVAWYGDNSGRETHPVGVLRPNELGLYDMSGNVWEWCQDWYGDYSSFDQTNPTGPYSGDRRVRRGGSYKCGAWDCRVSNRDDYSPDCHCLNIGFRLVLVP